MSEVAIVVLGYLVGAVPFSNLFARRLRKVDLRHVGTGTVSGTGLYRVAGFGPLAVAGLLDIAKGAVAPLVAGDRHVVAALGGGAGVVGHSWSVFLRGAGGRGISPSIGVLLVTAWPGAVLLLSALALGRLLHRTGLASFIADLLVVPVTALTFGAAGVLAGVATVVPMFVKRLAGNARPAPGSPRRVWVNRLLYDGDG